MKEQQNKDQLENAFRERASSYEATPPVSGWGDIASEMDKQERIKTSFFSLLAGFLLLLISAGVLLYTQAPSNDENEQQASLISEEILLFSSDQPCEDTVAEVCEKSSVEADENNNSKQDRKTNSSRHHASIRDTKSEDSNASNRVEERSNILSLVSNQESNATYLNNKTEAKHVPQTASVSTLLKSSSAIRDVLGLDRLYPKTVLLDSIENVEIASDYALETVVEELEDGKKSRNFDAWSMKLSIGANYSFKKITPSIDGFFIKELTNKNQFSTKNLKYQFSYQLRRKVIGQIGAYAGVGYRRFGEYTQYGFHEIVPETYEIISLNSTSFEIQPNLEVNENVVENEYEVMNYSLGLSYALRKRKTPQSIHAGLSFSTLLRKNVLSSEPSQELFYNNVSAIADVSWENTLPLNHKLSLVYALNFSYSISSIYTESSVYSSQPIVLSLSVGLLRGFD